MRPGLYNTAMVNHNDFICILYGRKAMGDDKGRTSFHKLIYRFLYQQLRLGIERGGRFIKNKDLRIF